MAKKILYDIGGRIQEISSSVISTSDDGNSLVIDKISFNTASLNIPNGILTISSSGFISSSNASDGDVIAWNSAQDRWVIKPSKIDISNLNASGDINDLYNNAKVRNLSNVSSGTLSVSNGGTGISKQDIINLGNDSAILVGNGNLAPSMIKKSDITNLSNKPILSANLAGNAWTTVTQSIFSNNVDVQIFTSSNGTQTWTKPQNTKFVRIIAAGGGGGGGSGATRYSVRDYNTLGATGGGGGEVSDTGIFAIDDKLSIITMTIGTGGLGANTPLVVPPNFNSLSGLTGNPGGTTYVNIGNTTITASGGFGGTGGLHNSLVTSSGGAGGFSGESQYISSFVDNDSFLNSSGYSGQNNFVTSSFIEYGSHSYNMRGGKLMGGGAGGGGADWSFAWGSVVYDWKTPWGGNSYFFYPPYPNNAGNHLFNFNNNLNDDLADLNPGMVFNSTIQFSQNYKKFGTHSARFNESSYIYETLDGSKFVWSVASTTRLCLLECWVNVDNVENIMTIASSYYNLGSRLFYFKMLQGGKLQYFQKNTSTFTFNSNNSIKPNVWTHICLSLEYVSSSNLKLRMHINGVLDSVHTVSQNPDLGYQNGTLFSIGSDITNLSTPRHHLNGYMDSLLFYSGVTTSGLTSTQASQRVSNAKNIFKYDTNFEPLQIPYSRNCTAPDPWIYYPTPVKFDAEVTISSFLLSYYNLRSDNINLNSQAKDLLLHSGGGGGGSRTLYENYIPFETSNVLTVHMTSNDISSTNPSTIQDSSLHRNLIYANSPINAIASPVGLPGPAFTDTTVLRSQTSLGMTPRGAEISNLEIGGTNSGFSVRGWFYLTSYGGRTGTNYASHLMVLGAGTSGMWVGIAPDTGKIRIFFNQYTNYAVETSIPVPLNEWFLLAFGYNRNMDEFYISINGNNAAYYYGTPDYAMKGLSYISSDYGPNNFVGYMKELQMWNVFNYNEFQLRQYYNNVKSGLQGPSIDQELPVLRGGFGGNGGWGSGGGGGGTSIGYFNSSIKQGGNGGDGYVAIISYKDF